MPFSLPFGMASTFCGMLVLAMAGGFARSCCAAALIGIGSSVFHPEASRVARLASGGRYGFAQSLFQVGGNAGQAIGPLLVALVVIPNGQALRRLVRAGGGARHRHPVRVGVWYRDHLAARRGAGCGLPRMLAGRAQPGDRGGRDPDRADLLQELLHGGVRLLLQLLPDRPLRGARCRRAQILLFVFLGAVARRHLTSAARSATGSAASRSCGSRSWACCRSPGCCRSSTCSGPTCWRS